MRKYSTREVAQTVKEDGIAYSVENYYNDFKFQDPELEKLWKEARGIFEKIYEKLKDADIPEQEVNKKIINKFLATCEENELSLTFAPCGEEDRDWAVYEIYSKEKGPVFLLEWEKDCDDIQLFFMDNAFNRTYLESLKSLYECTRIDDDEEDGPTGYNFNIPSIYEVEIVMKQSIPEIFKN